MFVCIACVCVCVCILLSVWRKIKTYMVLYMLHIRPNDINIYRLMAKRKRCNFLFFDLRKKLETTVWWYMRKVEMKWEVMRSFSISVKIKKKKRNTLQIRPAIKENKRLLMIFSYFQIYTNILFSTSVAVIATGVIVNFVVNLELIVVILKSIRWLVNLYCLPWELSIYDNKGENRV